MILTAARSAERTSRNFRPLEFFRGIGLRQVRLICGMILFSYLLSHYLNHALGNISLNAMEYGLRFHVAFWQSPVGTLLLYPALAVHASLGLWALYRRRYFRWKTTEIIQLTLGLSVPVMLCTHLIGERLGVSLYGLQRSYAQALYNFWVTRPDLGALQALLVLVAWIHGCIGLYFWLRLKRFFPRVAPVLLALAVLMPALALLGFYWCPFRSGCASCLPVATNEGHRDHSVAAPTSGHVIRAQQKPHPSRRGTLCREHVRRHARLDPNGGRSVTF